MKERGEGVSSSPQNDVTGFRIALVASILLTANLVAFMWFGYVFHYYYNAELLDRVATAISLVASAGLLMSILLSMNNIARWSRILFIIGAVAFLVYLVFEMIRIMNFEWSRYRLL